MKDGSNADKGDGSVGCWVGAGAAGWKCELLGGGGCWVGVGAAGWGQGLLGGGTGS